MGEVQGNKIRAKSPGLSNNAYNLSDIYVIALF